MLAGGDLLHHSKEDRDDGCRAPVHAARQQGRQEWACLADQVSSQGRQAVKVDLLQQLRCGCAVPDAIALQRQAAMVSLTP